MEKFPKSRRLRKRREFLAVQRSGRKLHGKYFLVILSANRPLGESDGTPLNNSERANQCGRVGITVSKKVGNAVVRNRVKRLVREHIRASQWFPEGGDMVIIAKPNASEILSLAEVSRDLDQIRKRCA